MKSLILCFVLALSVTPALAQELSERQRLDSVRAAVEKMPEDSNKLNAFHDLCLDYSQISPDTGLQYGFRALDLAKRLNLKRGQATANRRIGQNYVFLANYPKAIEHGLAALRIAEGIKYDLVVITANSLIGETYFKLEDYPASERYHLAALKVAQQTNDTNRIADVFFDLANLYRDEGKLDKALNTFNEARYYYKSVSDDVGLATTSGNLGGLYLLQNKSEEALPLVYEGLMISKHNLSTLNVGVFATLIGQAYWYIVSDTTGKVFPDSLRDKSSLLAKAERFVRQGSENLEAVGELNYLSVSHFLLSDILEKRGMTAEALVYYRKAVSERDSVFSFENKDKIGALTKQHEEDLKQKEIELQKVEITRAKQERWFYVVGLVGLLLIVALVTLFLFNTRKAKRLSDHLLHNILPVHTANELKAKGHAKAKRYENVTVLFTDFKEFAKLAEKLSPEETVSLIHHYFTQFDKIIEQHGLEKIKTIGDAYMAACGVPVEHPDHAQQTVTAAIEIRAFVENEIKVRRKNNRPYFDIRIGVHSGPVVAGIVGVKKFAYDIWGETVNLAARMEASGEPGKVNVSGSTYELIKDKFVCHPRGAVEVKHGALVEMFFVESEVRETAVA